MEKVYICMQEGVLNEKSSSRRVESLGSSLHKSVDWGQGRGWGWRRGLAWLPPASGPFCWTGPDQTGFRVFSSGLSSAASFISPEKSRKMLPTPIGTNSGTSLLGPSLLDGNSRDSFVSRSLADVAEVSALTSQLHLTTTPRARGCQHSSCTPVG